MILTVNKLSYSAVAAFKSHQMVSDKKKVSRFWISC